MTDTEKAALERRIDELCAEVERLHADQAHWELGNCPSCPNIADLQEALEQNAKLRGELADAPKCETCEAMLDCDECLRADNLQKERKRIACENAKLRSLCADMWEAIKTHKRINFAQLLRFGERVSELGVEAPS